MYYNSIKVTTTPGFDDIEIAEYIEPVTAHIVVGMNIFKDFLTEFSDFFGGESRTYQKTLSTINEQVIEKLKAEAYTKGANCIIGLRINTNEISAKGKSMMMVTAIGTAALAIFYKESTGKHKELLLSRIKNEINNLSNIVLNDSGIEKRIRSKFNLSEQEFKKEIEEAFSLRRNYLKLMKEKGISPKEEKEIELIKNDKSKYKELSTLQEILKNDEMIIKMRKNGKLEIIKKSKYDIDKELYLTSKYIVLDRNEK